MNRRLTLFVLLLGLNHPWHGQRGLFAAEPPLRFKFDFGSGATAPGYTAVAANTVFDRTIGYGFEPGATVQAMDRGGDPLRGDFVTSDKLFKFSVAVPEGNYRVTITLGDAQAGSTTTVKAETRRLMLERIQTSAGAWETRTFTVNVRTPRMPPGNAIKLDTREWNAEKNEAVNATWDDKLTLQFSDDRPAVCALEIEKVDDATTVFLVGDSTVTDQANEPYGTWGQQLPRWFKPTVAIANHAEHGETVKAFRAQRRWDKVMLLMKPGDYVFLQFGHNDLNQTGHDGIWPRDDLMGDWVHTHSEANTDYKWTLAAYAAEVKRRGGIPVIVSPMTKYNLRTSELNVAGMGDYPKAALEAAQLAGAAAIDLNAMSIEIAKGLGPQLAPKVYVDGLHSNTYGGHLFSRAIIEGIKRAGLALAQQIVDDAGTFDPSHPTPLPADFKVPLEPAPPRPPFPARGPGAATPVPAPPLAPGTPVATPPVAR